MRKTEYPDKNGCEIAILRDQQQQQNPCFTLYI